MLQVVQITEVFVMIGRVMSTSQVQQVIEYVHHFQDFSQNEYETVPRSSTTDRDCAPITVCEVDQYETVAPVLKQEIDNALHLQSVK